MKIIVTGGAGFIGLNLLKYWLTETKHELMVIDKFSYASNNVIIEQLLTQHPERLLVHSANIADEKTMSGVFEEFSPQSLINLAAESHVDNSISSPFPFIESNILGTYSLLEVTRKYLSKLPVKVADSFLFHHVSTDEVYGDLVKNQYSADENYKYAPSSPYSASKACSDHLVTAWGRTFGLNYLISNCSNNYGPLQHKEKLIPKVITNALFGKEIPLYGDGQQIRDWLFVKDHVAALDRIFFSGIKNESFNIGGNAEIKNIAIVELVCELLQEIKPQNFCYKDLIKKISDRPGHDRRYSIDSNKLQQQLSWSPKMRLREGLQVTITEYIKELNI